MDYEKNKDALAIVKQMVADEQVAQDVAEKYFPALAESEKISRVLREIVLQWKNGHQAWCSDDKEIDSILAWLEKQGEKVTAIEGFSTEFEKQVSYLIASSINKEHEYNEGFVKWIANALLAYAKHELEKQGEPKPVEPQQDMLSQEQYAKAVDECIYGEKKPANKVEPKFKVGDWVVTEGNNIVQIKAVNKDSYTLNDEWICRMSYVDKYWHLWTIQDAKDGDVLSYVTDEEDLWIMIYWSLYEPYEGHVHYHALLVNDNFGDKGTCCICIDNLKPATKGQRDLLFQKMKEAGYEWDADKKELKKFSEPKQESLDRELTEFEEKFLAITDSWCHGDSRVYGECKEQALKDAELLLSIARKQIYDELIKDKESELGIDILTNKMLAIVRKH